MDFIKKITKSHHRTSACLVDFSKAFDKVNHDLLLNEMIKLNLLSGFINWYKGFLSNRRYRVKYHNENLDYCRFALGVPQGSVSGPLLYIIYTQSLLIKLEKIPNLQLGSFADDLTIWTTSPNLYTNNNIIQSGLTIIEDWSNKYKMPLSKGKTESIVFSNYLIMLPLLDLRFVVTLNQNLMVI